MTSEFGSTKISQTLKISLSMPYVSIHPCLVRISLIGGYTQAWECIYMRNNSIAHLIKIEESLIWVDNCKITGKLISGAHHVFHPYSIYANLICSSNFARGCSIMLSCLSLFGPSNLMHLSPLCEDSSFNLALYGDWIFFNGMCISDPLKICLFYVPPSQDFSFCPHRCSVDAWRWSFMNSLTLPRILLARPQTPLSPILSNTLICFSYSLAMLARSEHLQGTWGINDYIR